MDTNIRRGNTKNHTINTPDYVNIDGMELNVSDQNSYGFMCNTSEHKMLFTPKGCDHQSYFIQYAKHFFPNLKGKDLLMKAKEVSDKFNLQGRIWVSVGQYDGVISSWDGKTDKTVFSNICNKFKLKPSNVIYTYKDTNIDVENIDAFGKLQNHKWKETEDFRKTRDEINTKYNQEHGFSCDAERHFKERMDENIEDELTAYHGSGADFDKFDHSFMGSGEGAQAFGWGTYVTTDRGTAKHYAQIASDGGAGTVYLCDGFKIDKNLYITLSIAKDKAKTNDSVAIGEVLKNIIDLNQNILNKKQKSGISNFELTKLEDRISDYQRALKYIKGLCGQPIENLTYTKTGQIIYEVEIPDDNGENYIRWNLTPFNVIYKILSNLTFLKYPNIDSHQITFENIYVLNTQTNNVIKPKQLSQELAKLGFVGIKIPTGYMSGGNNKGFNYVIFNENDITIKEKYDLLESKQYLQEMTVYHGSASDFNNFSIADKHKNYGNALGKGVYTTTRPQSARNFILNRNGTHSEGWIYELSIPDDNGTNYLDIDQPMSKQLMFNIIRKISKTLYKHNHLADFMREMLDCKHLNYNSFFRAFRYATGMDTQILNHYLYSYGYKGIKNIISPQQTWYIVFYPQDVKIVKRHKVDEEGNFTLSENVEDDEYLIGDEGNSLNYNHIITKEKKDL